MQSKLCEAVPLNIKVSFQASVRPERFSHSALSPPSNDNTMSLIRMQSACTRRRNASCSPLWEQVDPDRVLLTVLPTPSHLVRHLQLADLVTGIGTAMVCGAYEYAGPLFPRVKPLLIRNKMEHIRWN